jgi:hypothetical protein
MSSALRKGASCRICDVRQSESYSKAPFPAYVASDIRGDRCLLHMLSNVAPIQNGQIQNGVTVEWGDRPTSTIHISAALPSPSLQRKSLHCR